jgi:hypothetical protein
MAVLVVTLGGMAKAEATPWFVPDEGDSARLQPELAALWPGHDIELIVGPAVADGLGLSAGVLTLQVGAVEQRCVVADDLRTAVVLARSWLRTASPTEGWTPEPPPPPPEAPPVRQTDRVDPSPDPGLYVALGHHRPLGACCPGSRMALGAQVGRARGELALVTFSDPSSRPTVAAPEASRGGHDLLAVQGLAGLRLGAAPRPHTLTVAPSVVAGAALVAAPSRGAALTMAPMAGAALTLWPGELLGIRLVVLDIAQSDNREERASLHHRPALHAELALLP